jgi:hypothetical protein
MQKPTVKNSGKTWYTVQYLKNSLINDIKTLLRKKPQHKLFSVESEATPTHRYLIHRLSLKVGYLWRHVSSTAPPFTVYYGGEI